MKDGAVENASVIGLEGLSEKEIKMLNKCYYIKEIREDDPEYTEIIARERGKSPEEISNATLAFTKDLESQIELPEDKSKALEELPSDDEELDKELGV